MLIWNVEIDKLVFIDFSNGLIQSPKPGTSVESRERNLSESSNDQKHSTNKDQVATKLILFETHRVQNCS